MENGIRFDAKATINEINERPQKWIINSSFPNRVRKNPQYSLSSTSYVSRYPLKEHQPERLSREREREPACRHVVTILHYDTSPFTPGSFSSSRLSSHPFAKGNRCWRYQRPGRKKEDDPRERDRKQGPKCDAKETKRKTKRDSRLLISFFSSFLPFFLLFFFFYFLGNKRVGKKRTSEVSAPFFVAERC